MAIFSNNVKLINKGKIVAKTGASIPLNGAVGSLFFDTTRDTATIYNGTDWQDLREYRDGSSSYNAAPNGRWLYAQGFRSNGTYWVRPTIDVQPFQVYIDFTGTESGITGGGGWMKIPYTSDFYTQSSPWANTGDSSRTSPPYSGDFPLALSNVEIQSMLDVGLETRTIFETWGYGSVGVSDYQGAGTYMGFKAWDNSLHRGNQTGEDNLIEGGKPASVTYGFSNASGSINNFPNSGSAPTTANDLVWRQDIIYWRDTSCTYFPLRGAYNSDVDQVDERRYFPFNTGVGSATWVL